METLEFGEYTRNYFLVLLGITIFICIILALLKTKFKNNERLNRLSLSINSLTTSIFFMGISIIFTLQGLVYVIKISECIRSLDWSNVRRFFPKDILGIMILFWVVLLFVFVWLLFYFIKKITQFIYWENHEKSAEDIIRLREFLVRFFGWNQVIVYILTTFMVLYGLFISIPLTTDGSVAIIPKSTVVDNNKYYKLIMFTLIITLIGYFNTHFSSKYIKLHKKPRR